LADFESEKLKFITLTDYEKEKEKKVSFGDYKFAGGGNV
jgi:hypothetical protein